ncbi:alpha-crystallin B chain [Elysia marginata]|uniref:Alpha-crystallin B chain n=1 Tax=Elysia marginata TaxID=1093978 RepID=A0AAV4HU75_9GAST|nr:alpha-crystallin B chain [Elysia marginata]
MATRIPITKDYNFDDRQKKVWEDMERDMERRRREWEDEIDRMRKDFFTMRPDPPDFGRALDSTGTLSRLPARLSGRVQEEDDGKAIIEKDEHGQPMFKVRFNMKDYNPEEVNVKMDSSKIMVSARHEEKSEGSTVSREYSREVNIPRDVDPLALQCTLNPDGFLVVHAPLPVPGYPAVKDAAGSSVHQSPIRPDNASTVVSSSSSFYSSPSGGLNKMSSSYQTSSTSSSSSTSGRPQLQPQSSLPAYFHHSPQPQLHHPQQQQHQIKTHLINQQHAPPMSQHGNNNISMHSNSTSSHSSAGGSVKPQSLASTRSESMREEMMGHPDHVVPAYKPPPDLSKLDIIDSASTSSSSHQMRSSPIPPALRQAQPPRSASPASSSAASHHHHQQQQQQQQQQQHNASSAAATFHNPSSTFPNPPPFGTTPLIPPPVFSAPPPFGTLSSAFPTGPLFPDSTTQVNQLSTPQVTSHDGKFQLTMPIEDFKPEELTVKTQDGKVVICASREIKDGNRSQSSEMSREHSLPSNVDPLTVKAFFTDTGNLIVEAPFIRS